MSRTALRGPAHQLAVRMRDMRLIITTYPSNRQPREDLHFSAFHYSSRSVCLSVCLSTTILDLALQATKQLQCYKGKKNNVSILVKRLRREIWHENKRKSQLDNEHWLTPTRFRPFSGPWTNEVTKGYVSKSSAALNTLTIPEVDSHVATPPRSRGKGLV